MEIHRCETCGVKAMWLVAFGETREGACAFHLGTLLRDVEGTVFLTRLKGGAMVLS